MQNKRQPDGHLLSEVRAKQLIAGSLGAEMRRIAVGCCAPLSCINISRQSSAVIANGTITFVRTPRLLLGVTAAHVLREFEKIPTSSAHRIFVMDRMVEGIFDRVIDISDRLDLAVIQFDDEILNSTSKTIVPLTFWPPSPPGEGAGIMLAGYPGQGRRSQLLIHQNRLIIEFGYVCILGISRRVTSEQITWRYEPEFDLPTANTPPIPRNYDFGGISGSPLIGHFETESHISYFKLSGIASQANSNLENIVAKRADFIRANGSITSL